MNPKRRRPLPPGGLRPVTEEEAVATVELSRPIEWANQEIAALHFRTLEFGDLRRLGIGLEDMDLKSLSLDRLGQLLSRLTGRPIEAIDKLSPDDLGEVLEGLAAAFGTGDDEEESEEGNLLSGGRPTGAK